MDTTDHWHLHNNLRFFSHVIGVVIVGVGALVLIGWILDISVMKSIFPGLATMKINTAIAFMLSGLALIWLQTKSLEVRRRHYLIQISLAFVALIAIVTLLEYLAGWDFKIDQFLIKDTASSSTPGRMSSGTALAFVLASLSLWCLKMRYFVLAQLVAFILFFLALLALIGYGYGIAAFYKTVIYASMALHTALSFLFLCIGIFFAYPEQGLIQVVTANSPSGILARRLLPAAILIPIAIGWLRLTGERLDLYDTEFGTALLTLVAGAIFSVLIWFNTYSLSQMDAERQQVSQSLQQVQSRFVRTIEAAMDAIIVVDKDQHIVIFNVAAEKMFGYQADDIIGQSLNRLIPQNFRDIHQQHIRDFGVTGVTNRRMGALGDISGLRSNGEEFPIEASISQIEQENQKYFTVILRDITEREKITEALHESQSRLLRTIESAMDAIITVDNDQHIVIFNDAAEKMFGYQSDDIIGQPLDRLIPQNFRYIHQQHIRNFGITGVTNRRMGALGDIHGLRANGQEFPIEASISQIEQGGKKYFTVILRDITERIQAEENLRRLNEELEELVRQRTAHLQTVNKELEAFSYSVSHDLRAPLRAIDGFSQALLEDYMDQLDDDGKNYLNRVRAASQRMGHLIDDLIKLSRISRGELQRTTVNMSEIAREITESIREADPIRDVEFIIQDGLAVEGDERLLKVLLENLIANAWKYTSKKPSACIEFGQMPHNGQSAYFVGDNGAGFDMTYAEKLFGAFQRLHAGNEFEGTGIGLATCKRIIHRHGGTIWAESKVDEGATFYFTL